MTEMKNTQNPATKETFFSATHLISLSPTTVEKKQTRGGVTILVSSATPACYHSPAVHLSCRQKDPAAQFDAEEIAKVDLSFAQTKT